MPLNLLLPLALGLSITFPLGVSDFLSKGASAKIGSYRVGVYVQTISGALGLVPALFLRSSFDVSPFFAILLVLLAVVTFLGVVSIYGAYSKGMLSLVAPVANSYPAFAVIVSIAFAGARFSTAAILALLVTIAGIVLVSTSLSDLRRMASSRRQPFVPGIGPAFVAAIFIGLSFTIYGYSCQHLGYLLPTVAARFGSAGLGVALLPLLKPQRGSSGRWLPPAILLMSVLETVAVTSFGYGVITISSPTTIPLLATFGGMSAAVTVSCGIVILKERLEINHIIGVISLIGGVVALLYLTG
jgi:drug/metabolite transporter (DMT)-like permease